MLTFLLLVIWMSIFWLLVIRISTILAFGHLNVDILAVGHLNVDILAVGHLNVNNANLYTDQHRTVCGWVRGEFKTETLVPSHRAESCRPGLPDFSRSKHTKTGRIYQNGCKLYQTALNHTKWQYYILNDSKGIQILPKLGFLVWK
jgi:hypothetical protein